MFEHSWLHRTANINVDEFGEYKNSLKVSFVASGRLTRVMFFIVLFFGQEEVGLV